MLTDVVDYLLCSSSIQCWVGSTPIVRAVHTLMVLRIYANHHHTPANRYTNNLVSRLDFLSLLLRDNGADHNHTQVVAQLPVMTSSDAIGVDMKALLDLTSPMGACSPILVTRVRHNVLNTSHVYMPWINRDELHIFPSRQVTNLQFTVGYNNSVAATLLSLSSTMSPMEEGVASHLDDECFQALHNLRPHPAHSTQQYALEIQGVILAQEPFQTLVAAFMTQQEVNVGKLHFHVPAYTHELTMRTMKP